MNRWEMRLSGPLPEAPGKEGPEQRVALELFELCAELAEFFRVGLRFRELGFE